MNKITLLVTFFLFSLSLFSQNGPGGVGDSNSNRFWFIADQIDQADGTAVSVWENLGGNANNASPENTPPTYNSNFSNGFGGVEFDAANTGFSIADNLDLNNGGPYSQRTFTAVLKTGADISTRQIIFEEGGGTRGLNMYIFQGDLYYGAWNLNDDDGPGSPWGFSSLSTPIAVNTKYIITYIFKGNDSSTGTIECYLNGDLAGTITDVGLLYNHKKAGIGSADSNDTFGEAGSLNGSFPFIGSIAEFIMYDFSLNNSERISVENYLSSKYDIALSSNDIYDQDLSANGDYDFNLVSVNQQTASDQHQSTNRGTGLVSLNTSSTLSDGDYFSLGSDLEDQTALGSSNCNLNGKDVSRFQTTWRVSKNGTVTPNITINFSTIDADVLNTTDIQILIDDDQTFSTPVILDASSITASDASFTGLSINDGDYITFEISINRVIANTVAGLNLEEQERFRFEANLIDQVDGANVSAWENIGVNINNATLQNNPPSLVKDFVNGQNMLQFERSNNESFEIANNSDLNEGGEPYSNRTYSLVFQTGSNVTARQVIYEEGETTRGVVIYVFNEEVYFGAYNESDDGAGSPWAFKSVKASVSPNSTYVMTNVFSGNSTSTGTIETFLNGSSVGITTGVGFLYDHAGNISIGKNGDGNIFENGNVNAGNYFGGNIGELIIYNNSLNTNQIDILNNHLLAKYGVNPASNDIYAYDTNSGGDFDFNLIGVRETSATRIDATTYSSGVVKLRNPSSLASGDALFIASNVQDQTALDLSSIDCSTATEDNLKLAASWRVSLTGTPGTIDLELSYKDIDRNVNGSSEIELIIADNPDFTNPTRITSTEFCSSAIFENISFNEGDYFTFERRNIQPVIWDGTNYTNGSGPSNEPTLADEFKKLIINATGASLVEDAACTCLVIDPSSDLDTNNFNLNVSKDLSNDGQITGTGEVILNGSSAQSLSGTGAYENLRIDNPTSVDFTGASDLFGVLYVDQGTLNTAGNLYLRCNFDSPPKTAQVAAVNGVITGNVTVEQCYPARRAFRFISSSVSGGTINSNWQEGVNNKGLNFPTDNKNPNPGYGTHITGSTTGGSGFDATPSGNPSLYTFDNIGRDWIPVSSTTQSLEAGTPYRLFIRGDRGIDVTLNSSTPTDTRLRATGVLTTGPNSQTNLSDVAGSFNFIANPYHAQVDMNLLTTNSSNIRNTFYYVWDPTLAGSGGRGAYVTVDLSDGSTSFTDTGISGSPLNTANEFLQPMQAAFVLVDTNTGPTSVDFKESHKNVNPDQTETKSLSQSEYINIQLFDADSYTQGNTASDGLKIKFDKSYSTTSKDDAPKLGNLDENLARKVGSDFSSIELRPFPEEEERLELFMNQYRREAYVMKFDLTDNLNTQVFIEDKYLNQVTEVTQTEDTYSFTVDESIPESKASDRFRLVFEPVSLSTMEETLVNASLYPNPTKGSFSISGENLGEETEVEIYNMIGQQVYKTNLENQLTTEITDFNGSAGVYLVKLKTNQGERTFKLIKQ
ncbi:T9SS type A sorting domain-containing protein [Psychroflexus salinarum]|uniref:T9SS type A sorting domain-containing protein n=1 Tax=Psychroflexus salinarum TaxID=546024 RepID=A0ABW3GQF7_9FLAO